MNEPRCSCDAFGEGPCPVHARENALQDEVLALRADRDEWRQQHENLLAIYQAEVAERARVSAALNNALSGESDAVHRAESAEMGCNIAYRREPTQAEGDAHADGADECFVTMGGWTGRRCRACGRWVWGGPTACEGCVRREERDEARDCQQDDVCKLTPGCQRHWEERNRELVTEVDRLRLLLQKAEEVVMLARTLGAYQWEDRLDDSKTSDDAKHDARELSIAVYLYDRAATGKS